MQNKFKSIILLGEMHGTESNIWALEALCAKVVATGKDITIALEVTPAWNEALAELGKGDAVPLRDLVRDSEPFESGRISEKHIDAYVKLAAQGVRFVAIRDDNEDWNTTDKGMADNILKASEGTDTLIATLGSFHIMKKSFTGGWEEGGYIAHPTGELLKEVATSIVINYQGGTYRNFETVAPLPLNKKCELLESKVGAFIAADNEEYDYEVCVRGGGAV